MTIGTCDCCLKWRTVLWDRDPSLVESVRNERRREPVGVGEGKAHVRTGVRIRLSSLSTSEPRAHQGDVLFQPRPDRSPVQPELDGRGLPEACYPPSPVAQAGVVAPPASRGRACSEGCGMRYSEVVLRSISCPTDQTSKPAPDTEASQLSLPSLVTRVRLTSQRAWAVRKSPPPLGSQVAVSPAWSGAGGAEVTT